MPPSTRSRPSAPPDRIYESTTPLAQAKLPPIRQRVYGRHSLGAPLTKKRQGTLTQIGFVNPEKIEGEIAEYERGQMERGKRRKTEGGTPLRRGLRAKPVIGTRDTPVSGSRLKQMMDGEEVKESSRADVMTAQLRQQESIQRLDDTPEPEAGEGRTKKKRKSRKGITIGVKTVIIKVESPEVQRTQYHAHPTHHEEETQREVDIDMVVDSFHAAPTFEEKRDYESYVRMEAEQEREAEMKRNRVVPDSDAESEDESIVYDSNDERSREATAMAPQNSIIAHDDGAASQGASDIDLDEVKDSVEEKSGPGHDLDDIPATAEDGVAGHDLDLKREISDSPSKSEYDEQMNLDKAEPENAPAPAPRPAFEQEDTLILNSFSASLSGSPAVPARMRPKAGSSIVSESFSVPGSPSVRAPEQRPAVIKDSFYKKPPTLRQDSSFERSPPSATSPIPEETEDFVPSSSVVSVPEAPLVLNVPETVAAMPPPPVTPRKPRRTEIPNTGSTCSELSTQSTIHSMTPNSVRSNRYDQSPTKAYNRSPSKTLNKKNLPSHELSLPRLDLRKNSSSLQLNESQISTQGTSTQRSRVSQASTLVKPETQTADLYDEGETTLIPESPSPIKPERNGTQNTTDTNSPSRQIHSEISAALSSERDYFERAPSSGRTIRFLKTEVKDSQAESDDEESDVGEYRHSIEEPEAHSDDKIYNAGEYHHSMEAELQDRHQNMEIVVEGDRIPLHSSKAATPRVVRFQSIPADVPAQLQFHSSPLSGGGSGSASVNTQVSSMSRPSVVGAETQMRSQWLDSDGLASGSIVGNGAPTQGTMGGESQWLGDFLPESLMGLIEEELSVPPIMDDDSVWDEFRSSRRSGIDEIED